MNINIKEWINFLFIILILTQIACSDFLDRTPMSDPVDEEYWNSQEDAEAAVLGGYGLLRAAFANHGAYYAYGDVTGTNVFNSFIYEDEDWNQMNQFRLDYSISSSEPARPMKQFRNYSLFYRVVNQCNRALRKIDLMDDDLFDEGIKEKLRGELYFLRGYTYFTMYRIWGEVPIVTTSPDNLMDAEYVARSPLYDVAALIYGDLEDALSRIPWEYSNNSDFSIRANKGVVFATLAHMAAWDQDYPKCIAACDSIINSSMYSLENQSTLEKLFLNDSKELIFQLYFNAKDEAPSPSSDITYTTVFFLDMLASPYLNGLEKENPNKQLNQSFINTTFSDTADVRYDKFFGLATGGRTVCTKYSDVHVESVATNSIYITNNFVIFRLADIMLLKAEALTASGKNTGEAISILNTIRERAGLGDYDGSTSLQRAILNERAAELFVEGHRFYDLVRYYYITGSSLFPYANEAQMSQGMHYWPLDPDLFENNSIIRQTSYWQGKI